MPARKAVAIIAWAVWYPGVALAQPTAPASGLSYPTKPIRIIVPTSPGGGVDIVARAIGQRLTESWGQPVVIDNRSGAAGTIGADAAARATSDGCTLMICTSAVLTIHPHLYPKLAYDTLRDFAPVTIASSSPFLLVAHPALQARTVTELIALAKLRPGQLNYSSSGNGSVTHLAGLQSAQVREKLEADGSDLVANTPAEFASVMRADHHRWPKVIKAAELRADD